MNRRVRTLLAAVVIVSLTTLLTAQGAGAQEGPTAMVTPSTGLQDGQVVTVTGTGFNTGTSGGVGVIECPASNPPVVFDNCVIPGQVVPAFGGSFSGTYTVQRTIGGGFDCASAPGACVISVTNLFGGTAGFTDWVSVPISFRNPPQSIADCQRGGWQHHTDAEGQPFRNQGLCVMYVVTHKP